MTMIGDDNSLVYDYQECLNSGVCGKCSQPLKWELESTGRDDRFCHAFCCMTKYSMVPEKVRIISVFSLDFSIIEEDIPDMDADFIKELEKL